MKKLFGMGKNKAVAKKAPPGPPQLGPGGLPMGQATALPTKAGAVSVDGNTTVFRVLVPDGVKPGDEFQVYACNRIVRVRCPPGSSAGQSLQITVPTDPSQEMGGGKGGAPGRNPNLPPDSDFVQKIENNGNGPPAYMVTIPDGVRGGNQFPVTIQGQQLMVTCPPNARSGSKVRIVPPPPPADLNNAPSNNRGSGTGGGGKPKDDDEATQLFEVMVPMGVKIGHPFALMASGVRVLVTCPTNAGPGQRIRFKLPLALTQKPKVTSAAEKIKLSYDKDGWTRTIRVSDMKFQWVRMDENGDVDTNTRFDTEKSAYVRKLDFKPTNEDRLRDAELTLVPASQATVDSRIRGSNGDVLVTYSEIASAQGKDYEEKFQWFQDTCTRLSVEWTSGHMRMNVRRQYLLEDSVDAVMSLNRRDLRKLWRFEFIGEMGIDAGGLAREWFQLVTEEIFDPDMGLWMSSETNQMCMQINPASKFICDDYLVYYRFLGRVMGKSLFDHQLVSGHMVGYLYKHILGYPLKFKDIGTIDQEYYNNLKQIAELVANGDDVEMLCLDFTTTTDNMGAKEDIDLVPGGSDIDVTNENYPEYLEACFKHRMLERVKPQLNELLLGFYDVIPEPMTTVFDFQELELMMCGLPEIDVEDWMNETEYSGDYEDDADTHPTCVWFWEVVNDYDQEMKARLLQFVTGTTGVPSRGFGVLHGIDGSIRRFTIHGLPKSICLYPRAHTCFNRIDLPTYDTKEDLEEKLKIAITMASTGFDIE